MASPQNVMQGSCLINTQISTFLLNSKSFHLDTTYEEMANFIQIGKKKNDGSATVASNPLNYSGTHAKMLWFFSSIRSISLNWNSNLSAQYPSPAPQIKTIINIIQLPKDNLKSL